MKFRFKYILLASLALMQFFIVIDALGKLPLHLGASKKSCSLTHEWNYNDCRPLNYPSKSRRDTSQKGFRVPLKMNIPQKIFDIQSVKLIKARENRFNLLTINIIDENFNFQKTHHKTYLFSTLFFFNQDLSYSNILNC